MGAEGRRCPSVVAAKCRRAAARRDRRHRRPIPRARCAAEWRGPQRGRPLTRPDRGWQPIDIVAARVVEEALSRPPRASHSAKTHPPGYFGTRKRFRARTAPARAFRSDANRSAGRQIQEGFGTSRNAPCQGFSSSTFSAVSGIVIRPRASGLIPNSFPTITINRVASLSSRRQA